MTTPLPAALTDTLSVLLGAEGWRTDADSRRRYGEDDSRRWALADAVALPQTREQVQAIVRACRAHRVPLVARGAGTGTAGAAVPFRRGGGLSVARLYRILPLRPADRCAGRRRSKRRRLYRARRNRFCRRVWPMGPS